MQNRISSDRWIPKMSSRFAFVSALVGCSCWMGVAVDFSQAAERWTSLNGTTTVEAEFIGLWGNQVVLELPGSRRVSVNVDELIAESRIQARRMAEEQKLKRAERRQQILAEAAEATAAAPNPLPKPPAAPAYQMPPQNAPLMQQADWFVLQVRNGHVSLAMFDALPSSYQADYERLVLASVAKNDIQASSQALGAIHSIGDLIVTKQRWLFSHPRLAAMDPNAVDTLKSVLLSVGGLIRDGLDPEQMKLEELGTRPFRDWLVDQDSRMAPHLAALIEQLESNGLSIPTFEVKDEKGGKATLVVSMGSSSSSIPMEQVEGKWVSQDLNAENWAKSMKQWEEQIAAAPDASVSAGQSQMFAMGVKSLLQPAQSAGSARELHAQMDAWFAMLTPAVSQLQALAGVSRSNSGGYGGGYGDGGYDDGGYGEDYGEEYGEEMNMDEGYDEEMMEEYGR